MKRVLSIFLALCMGITLTACGNKSGSNADTAAETPEALAPTSDTAEMTITIPSGYSLEDIAEEDAYISAVHNDNDSVTYTMTQAQYQAILDNMSQRIDTALDDLVGTEDLPNVVSIEANDDYTEFVVTTKSENLDPMESIVSMLFYMYGELYSVYTGNEADNIHVSFINESSGEVIAEEDSSGAA